MFHDLRQMVPEHLKTDVLDDGWTFTDGQLWSSPTFMDWMTPCELAETVLSDLQDSMTDAESVWWPLIGRKRLGYRVECIDGRPELVLFT